MRWFASNWIWIVFIGGMLVMHLGHGRGHGGMHGMHGMHGTGHGDESRSEHTFTDDQHTHPAVERDAARAQHRSG